MRTLFSCETHLKRVFLPILGDVLDLDFILGGAPGANNFYSLWLQFFLWFWAIFSRVPTHLTTDQLKIPPPTHTHPHPLEKQEANRSQA